MGGAHKRGRVHVRRTQETVRMLALVPGRERRHAIVSRLPGVHDPLNEGGDERTRVGRGAEGASRPRGPAIDLGRGAVALAQQGRSSTVWNSPDGPSSQRSRNRPPPRRTRQHLDRRATSTRGGPGPQLDSCSKQQEQVDKATGVRRSAYVSATAGRTVVRCRGPATRGLMSTNTAASSRCSSSTRTGRTPTAATRPGEGPGRAGSNKRPVGGVGRRNHSAIVAAATIMGR